MYTVGITGGHCSHFWRFHFQRTNPGRTRLFAPFEDERHKLTYSLLRWPRGFLFAQIPLCFCLTLRGQRFKFRPREVFVFQLLLEFLVHAQGIRLRSADWITGVLCRSGGFNVPFAPEELYYSNQPVAHQTTIPAKGGKP